MSPKIIMKFYVLIFAIFFVVAVFLGLNKRRLLTDQYNNAVKFYHDGNYVEAFIAFNNLRGWGERIVDITPEEYCEMIASKVDVKTCPECGAVID